MGPIEIGPQNDFSLHATLMRRRQRQREGSNKFLCHVKLTRGFWLLETPTSQALYKEIMRTDPAENPEMGAFFDAIGKNPSELKGDDLPVIGVSWHDAYEFCEALTELLPKGLKATLPTEAQWEYACRAGTKTAFWFGDFPNEIDKLCGRAPCKTMTSVKSHVGNPWGLYHMHGNVWEWQLNYYGEDPSNDPSDVVVDPTGPKFAFIRAIRGGSFCEPVWVCSSDVREYAASITPSAAPPTRPIGFRVLLTYDEESDSVSDKAKDDGVIVLPPSLDEWEESSSRAAGTEHILLLKDQRYVFRWIPAGEFVMGSSNTDWRFDREVPHRVKLTRGFWLLETPTTQTFYREIMGANPSRFKGSEFAVESVSWREAVEFCEALTKRLPDGLKATLPTEAQWEYACRAGTTTEWFFGDDYYDTEFQVNWSSDKWANRDVSPRRTPVKRFDPNAWGLYDMHGNVWEWQLDWFGDYPSEDETDPRGPDVGSRRVCRGGSWRDSVRLCRSAARNWHAPDNRYDILGFRVLLVANDNDELKSL